MKRTAIIMCAALGLLALVESSHASWGSLGYGGYQPWWNVFAKRNRCMSQEEERLQRFWHDYYDAQRRYYRSLEHLDWVTYYKNHGQQINGGGYGGGQAGCQTPVQFAPVTVSPSMAWANPSGAGANYAPGSGGVSSNGAPAGYYAMPTGVFPGYSPPSSVVAPSSPVSMVSFPYAE